MAKHQFLFGGLIIGAFLIYVTFMFLNFVVMDEQYKCGYCQFLINSQCADFLEHECFGQFNEEIHQLVASDTNILTIVDKETNITVPLLNLSGCSWEELLIKAVQDRPALYNFKLPLNERSNMKKKELWQEITNRLGTNLTVEEVKAKWKYLRDCYTKAKKKVNQYIPSGSAAVQPADRDPGFRHFSLMRFLDDSTDRQQTVSSVSISQRTTVPQPSPSPSTSSCSEIRSGLGTAERTNKKKKDESSELEKQILKLATPVQNDGVDGFLIRLGESLRRFPYRERSLLEIDIMKLVFEREFTLNTIYNNE